MDLINTVIAAKHNMPESLNGPGPVSEILVGICEMRGRIAQLSTLCKRFAAILRRCDVETFLNVGGRIFAEIAPLEKRIDMHMDLLRRDEFREMECVSDIAKCVLTPQFSCCLDSDSGCLGFKLSLIILRKHISKDLNMILQNESWDMRYRLIWIWICFRLLLRLPRLALQLSWRMKVSFILFIYMLE